ncbi:hypothetical protein Hte_001170 [Hypoxylon texense]
MHYSQAIRVGGWDRTTLEIKQDILGEVDRAFDNVYYTLKHAGGEGWSPIHEDGDRG